MAQDERTKRIKAQLLEIEMARLTATTSELVTLDALREEALRQLQELQGQTASVAA